MTNQLQSRDFCKWRKPSKVILYTFTRAGIKAQLVKSVTQPFKDSVRWRFPVLAGFIGICSFFINFFPSKVLLCLRSLLWELSLTSVGKDYKVLKNPDKVHSQKMAIYDHSFHGVTLFTSSSKKNVVSEGKFVSNKRNSVPGRTNFKKPTIFTIQ